MLTEGVSILPVGIDMYVRLVWVFVVIISILMLCLCYLFLAMRRALQHELESIEFSHLMIEGMEAERRRIAGELHDVVLPLARDTALAARIRSICTKLMPPDLEQFSLQDSLAGLCGEFSKRTGIKYNWLIEDEFDFSGLSAEHQLHIFRIVQECFSNIEKHSRSDMASLIVRRNNQDSQGILICVSDDGQGMCKKPGDSGLGMKIMRQRAVILGARLDFINESGNGLMVRLELSPPAGSGE